MKEIAIIEDDRDENNQPPEDNEEECVKWYAYYSEKEGREYYYNPQTRVVTWILPDDAHAEGVAHDKKSGQSITRRVNFCRNDSDNEDDEYRDGTSERNLDTTLKDKDHTLYPPNKAREISMPLRKSSGEHQFSQCKTSSNEKSRNGTGIVVMCAAVLTAGFLVFQHQHQQQNLVNDQPITKETIVQVPIPPPLQSPPDPLESSVDMNSEDYKLSTHSDSLKDEIMTADETMPDATIIEKNKSPQADAKRAKDNYLAELNKEDDMITSDRFLTTTSENTKDASEIDADTPREKDLDTAMQETVKENASRNSKVISLQVGDGSIQDSTTQKIRLEIEVDVVGATPQNELELNPKENDTIEKNKEAAEEESSSTSIMLESLEMNPEENDTIEEQDKKAAEEESSSTTALLESPEITVAEEMEEDHNDMSDMEHRAVGEELHNARDLPVEKSLEEEKPELIDEKETSISEGTTQPKEVGKEEQSHKISEKNRKDAETTAKAKRIAAERIVQELSPMMKNTAKIGTFEDFVAQTEKVMLMKEQKKMNNKGSRSGCLVPFAHLVSKKCRNSLKEKPVFDLKGLVDSMLQ